MKWGDGGDVEKTVLKGELPGLRELQNCRGPKSSNVLFVVLLHRKRYQARFLGKGVWPLTIAITAVVTLAGSTLAAYLTPSFEDHLKVRRFSS